MPSVERFRGEEEVTGVERTLELQLGSLGGFELRPTRLFLWSGDVRDDGQRVLPIGGAPRSLDVPRRETEVRAGAVRVRTLGNPLLTIALAGVHAVRRALDEEPEGGPTPPGSAGRGEAPADRSSD